MSLGLSVLKRSFLLTTAAFVLFSCFHVSLLSFESLYHMRIAGSVRMFCVVGIVEGRT